MGSAQSSHARNPSSITEKVMDQKKDVTRGVGGRAVKEESTTEIVEKFEVLEVEEDLSVAISSSESDEEEEEEYEIDSLDDEEIDDEEDNEDLMERLAVLEESRKLKFFANAYLHPEAPVKAEDPSCFARNFFGRASAEDAVSDDEAVGVLADAAALRQEAKAWMHPEEGVSNVDSATLGRNYFNRPSAGPVDEDEDDERFDILEDAEALKKAASAYLHPEAGVVGGVGGRCYFERSSAPEGSSAEEEEERARVLADALALKKAASAYTHPEEPVKCEDSSLFGRNYFSRASAVDVTPVDESEEQASVLADAEAMANEAKAWLHPEIGVQSADPTTFGRNYFNRASGGAVDEDEDDERSDILEEAEALKKVAVAFLHPEAGVEGSVGGRCYFERNSAPEESSPEEAEEHARILSDVLALKKAAAFYMHPEEPVKCEDSTLFGRNYFARASAVNEAEERENVLADAAAMAKQAKAWLHPEVGVKDVDPTTLGRNYFNRASGVEDEDDDLADILEDVQALKEAAVAYLHPEAGIEGGVGGRCYFERASAPEESSLEEADERALVLADALALKKSVVAYVHPEEGVECDDSTVFGRNYFSRASSVDESEERENVLADAAAMAKEAKAWLHPEVGVKDVDPTTLGRNYFNRASGVEDEDDDLADILEDAHALKKAAVAYLHPEAGIEGGVGGRCYFKRSSAPEEESVEDADERALVLADALALKKSVSAYLHPEEPVKCDDSTVFGRNYFSRASAVDMAPSEESEEQTKVLADAAAMAKEAKAWLHPEVGVEGVDPTTLGRNYFNRASGVEDEDEDREDILEDTQALKAVAVAYLHPEAEVEGGVGVRCFFERSSAPEEESLEEAEERALVLAEALALKKSVVAYMHPEEGVKCEDPSVFGRSYFSRPSAATESEDEERASILEEASALAKHARAWLHPEVGVKTSDPTVLGRNYFSRPSASNHGVASATHDAHEFAVGEEFEAIRNDSSDAGDYFEMDLEEDDDAFGQMRESFARYIPRPPTPTEHIESEFIDEEEEINLSRSPSSVMLFDAAEGNLSRKASAVKLSAMGDGKMSSPFMPNMDGSRV